MKTFAIAFATQFFSCFLIVANTRAFTEGSYRWIFITAFFITQSFFAGKWMIETKSARGTPAYFGFLLGGTLGSLAAIFTMKHLCGSVN